MISGQAGIIRSQERVKPSSRFTNRFMSLDSQIEKAPLQKQYQRQAASQHTLEQCRHIYAPGGSNQKPEVDTGQQGKAALRRGTAMLTKAIINTLAEKAKTIHVKHVEQEGPDPSNGPSDLDHLISQNATSMQSRKLD